MCEITISYDNNDGLFRLDAQIRQALNRWPGEETDSGQDLETHIREIIYAFEDEGDDSLVLVDLEEILEEDFTEITYTGKPEAPIALKSSRAQDVFSRYSRLLGWDFPKQADVLLYWCGEEMIGPLLQYIQAAGQIRDYEKFLADNFGGGVSHEERLPGRRVVDSSHERKRASRRSRHRKTQIKHDV